MGDVDIKKSVGVLALTFGITYAIHFGSTVRGEAGVMSDVDILLGTTAPLSLADESTLRVELARILGVAEDNIDISYASQASGLLVTRAFSEGEVLYDDGTGAMRRGQLQAWRRMQTEYTFREARTHFARHVFAT